MCFNFQKERSWRAVSFENLPLIKQIIDFRLEIAKFLKRDRNLLVKDKSFTASLCNEKKSAMQKDLIGFRLFLILVEKKDFLRSFEYSFCFFVNLRRRILFFCLNQFGYVWCLFHGLWIHFVKFKKRWFLLLLLYIFHFLNIGILMGMMESDGGRKNNVWHFWHKTQVAWMSLKRYWSWVIASEVTHRSSRSNKKEDLLYDDKTQNVKNLNGIHMTQL